MVIKLGKEDSDMHFGNIPGLFCTGMVIEARSPAISLELCEVVRLVLNTAVEANKRDLKDYKELELGKWKKL